MEAKGSGVFFRPPLRHVLAHSLSIDGGLKKTPDPLPSPRRKHGTHQLAGSAQTTSKDVVLIRVIRGMRGIFVLNLIPNLPVAPIFRDFPWQVRCPVDKMGYLTNARVTLPAVI